jgi:hypothetical protein
MALSRKLRGFAPWLLGIFLIAQFAAVVPLIITDLQHAIEADHDIADDFAATGALKHVHAHHRHQNGTQHDHTSVDFNDQCCTIHHHLAGVLPFTAPDARDDFVTVASAGLPSRRPLGADPGGLERPPKLLVSI